MVGFMSKIGRPIFLRQRSGDRVKKAVCLIALGFQRIIPGRRGMEEENDSSAYSKR